MKKKTFHLISNAHLDPVWLWNWQEGLNEGIRTCRTVLDLMDEFPELTFSRGESAVYRHIEQHDPSTFVRIAEYVKQGRWEIIGGTEIQPDTNLPATETFARHFTHGLTYFADRFNKRPRVAWAADSFGHAAGLPEIMAAAGMTGFLFTRPFPDSLPIAKPAFWWEGPGGSRILCYRPDVGWYGTEREEIRRRLDATLEAAEKKDLENVGVFFGLGDHGGGPTRQQILDLRAWAAEHPEINLVFSGMQKLLDALRGEVKRNGEDFIPTFKGELNFCLRGCYASVARFKFLYRKTENALLAAERSDAVIRAALKQSPDGAVDAWEVWNSLLFNTFHDILPGSSIERAFDEQIAWLGGAYHQTQRMETGALNALAAAVDTTVPKPKNDMPEVVPFLVWNPHPWTVESHVEMEANMDYRPIKRRETWKGDIPLEVRGPNGRAVPFQTIATECLLKGWEHAWRRRVSVKVKLPPMGWGLYTFGWVEDGVNPPVPKEVESLGENTVSNARFTVKAVVGEDGVQILKDGKPLLKGRGLSAIVVKDPHGSWGGPEAAEAAGLSDVIETWKIASVRIAEAGSEVAVLQVRLAGAHSWMDMRFSVARGESEVAVKARVLWNEQSARLKLVFPVDGCDAAFDVPGAAVRRQPCGEVPGGRWVRVFGKTGKPVLGFASDALYCFDCTKDGALRATVARASKYAYAPSGSSPEADSSWDPAVDCGELKFNFVLTDGGADLEHKAHTLEQPPVAWITSVSKGSLPRSGSLASLSPASVQLLTLKPAVDGNGLVLRIRETTGRNAKASLKWLGTDIDLGTVEGHTIATWRLTPGRGVWRAKRTNIAEE